jgi:hypothetical protein
MMKRGFLAVCLCVLTAGTSFAKTIIYLNDGRTVEGEIVEESNTYVRIELEGVGLTYWLDEIKRIETDAEQTVSTTLSEPFDAEDLEEIPMMPAPLVAEPPAGCFGTKQWGEDVEEPREFQEAVSVEQEAVFVEADLLEEPDLILDRQGDDESEGMAADSGGMEFFEASGEEAAEPQPYRPEFFDTRPLQPPPKLEPAAAATEKTDFVIYKSGDDKPQEKKVESSGVKLSQVSVRARPGAQEPPAPQPSYRQPPARPLQKSVSKLQTLKLPRIDPAVVQTILKWVFSSSGIIVFVVIATHVLLALSLQIIAAKTFTTHGWLAWIPAANLFLMCRIGRRPMWWLFFFPIPLANIIMLILLWRGIADSRGKPSWIGFLILIPPGFLFVPLYLAFSK